MVVLSQIIREVFIGTYLLFPNINAGFAVVRAARNHMSIVARASLERTMRQSWQAKDGRWATHVKDLNCRLASSVAEFLGTFRGFEGEKVNLSVVTTTSN